MINYSPVVQITDAEIKKDYEYKLLKGNLDNIGPFELTIIEVKNKK